MYHTTAITMFKLKILFVCVCVFNYLHPNMTRSKIWEQFMGEACPTFMAPHYFMFGRTSRVIQLYVEKLIYDRLHAVHKEYNGLPFASTSVDLWTSKHSAQGFAAMDIQYGNPMTATIDSFTLAVKYFPEEHDHVVLVEFIKNVSSYFGFVTVLAWILLASIDGGSNIVLATSVLGITRIYCYTHRLH